MVIKRVLFEKISDTTPAPWSNWRLSTMAS